MKKLQLVLPCTALGLCSFLLLPASGFSKNFSSLGPGNRDVRLFNNFVDGGANNNVRGTADFPGALGAEQAIWKGANEWGSVPRGPGNDTHQPDNGHGGANFDSFWAGTATGTGGTNDNIVSTLGSCASGVFAFAELPSSNGWRIRFCEAWFWTDGPAGITGVQADIQGVMAHEYGHALGLGHSTVNFTTMFASGTTGTVFERSIHPDDIAGVQCIYGVASAAKPVITNVAVTSGSVTITGTGFDSTATNEVWFTPRAVTTTSGDPRVRVLNVAASAGGTSITVGIPAAAGMGEVIVRNGSTGGVSVSNAFPTTLGEPLFGESVFSNGSGINPACFSSTTPPQLGRPFDLQVDGSAHPGGAGFTGVLVYAGSTQIPLAVGELLVDLSTPQYGFLIGPASGGIDIYSITPLANINFLGARATAQGFTFSLSQTVLCNAEQITLGAAP